MEKKYGAATLLLVLHFLEDNGNKLNILKDIADRLVPGAAFLMLDITGGKEQIRQNLKTLRLLLPDSLDEEQINNRLNRIENELFPVSEQRLSELCAAAGFEPQLGFFKSSIYGLADEEKINGTKQYELQGRIRNQSMQSFNVELQPTGKVLPMVGK